MRSAVFLAAALLAGCATAPSMSVEKVAPGGVLRVAIGVGPSASAFWATRDPKEEGPRGVTVELGRAAAAKLGVPVKLVEYAGSGAIAAAAAKDEWDISFMPRDSERDKLVDQGPAYVLYESSYLLRAGSDIPNSAAVDRAGVWVGAVEGTSTSRTVSRSLTVARLRLYPKAADAIQDLSQGHVDALAMGREALVDVARRLPGTRLLGEVIQSTSVVVVVPKERPSTRAWAAQFLEGAKADGTVRRALDSAGFTSAAVAP